MNKEIAIIGLGYVGLPLAVEFGKKFNVIGYDLNSQRIQELENNLDNTNEVTAKEISDAKFLNFTNDPSKLLDANIFIITVPTPVDKYNKPDFSFLVSASELVGSFLKVNDIVIYESTVYPGATEEICVPALEKTSNLKYNIDFFCGYSPERINPGDKEHRLTNIVKVTSGSNKKIAKEIDHLYQEIINAGTHMAKSIRVAEAAKVIENTQRDVNIALINELTIIFNKLNIDTQAVLDAAATKWNFIDFRPGIVGGHCIGVDPYYLTYKANEIGYSPEMILAGRRLNNNMPKYIVNETVKLMTKKRIPIINASFLILGFTFKENCPDIRNTRVIDIVNEIKDFGSMVDIFDPIASSEEVHEEYGINLVNELKSNKYDAVIIAVAHDYFRSLTIKKIRTLCKQDSVIFDVKNIFDSSETDGRL